MNHVCAWGSTQKKRELAEDVAYFCIQELMPRMKTLEIAIDLCNDLGPEQYGYCLAVDTREFEMQVNAKLSKDDFITTVAHEMVHVCQYARRRLSLNGKSSYKTYEEYLDLWYEKEAHELEEILREKYKSLKTKGKKI